MRVKTHRLCRQYTRAGEQRSPVAGPTTSVREIADTMGKGSREHQGRINNHTLVERVRELTHHRADAARRRARAAS
jgi:hypothetical protein